MSKEICEVIVSLTFDTLEKLSNIQKIKRLKNKTEALALSIRVLNALLILEARGDKIFVMDEEGGLKKLVLEDK